MENFRERQIATINTIEDRVNGHKNFLMGKKRIRYSFREIINLKLAEFRPRVFKYAIPCDNWQKKEAYYKGVGVYDYIDSEFVPICVGDKWGGPDVTCFFRKEVEIPKELAGERVELQFYVGGDSLVSVNGEPKQGLDPFRNSFLLTPKAKAGEKFNIDVEAYCFYAAAAEGLEKRTFECCTFSVIDKEISDIYWDFRVAANLLEINNISAELSEYIEAVFKETLNYIDLNVTDRDEFLTKLKTGDKILKEKIYKSEKFRSEGLIDLVAHSHLDIIYMWDYKEFVRKAGRTHATMLALMDEFPEFKFCQSQSVTYKEIKENFPQLFKRIKEYVKAGRWEVIGAMWVEPDCNLPSGESFVRQLLEGRKFFQKELGVTPKTVWLPDVFGNSYGMPQILAKSGIKYFVTHKPCVWNDTNKLNHHTFWWQGPDGSRVFAALSPSHFVGTCEPNHIMLNWDNYTDKANIGESMYCYGWGDGGGGVSPDMIENAKRLSHIVGMPDTRIVNAEESLDAIYNRASSKNLPVLQSDIYLEAHRSVPTIRTEIKKYNRRCERLLHDAELYGVMAEQYGYKYDSKSIEEFLRMFLTNQFHDVLPGTHVAVAYDSIIKQYKKAVELGEKVRNEALEVIARNVKFDQTRGRAIAVFNSLSYATTQLITLKSGDFIIEDDNGNLAATQKVCDLNGNETVKFAAKDIPAFGYKVFYIKDGKATNEKCAEFKDNTLENKFYKISFAQNGDIVSIYDKSNDREVLKGAGNRICLFEDNASSHDAWDIIPEHRDFEVDISGGEIAEFENGPVEASVIYKKKFLNSTFEQKIIVYNDIDRIDFETKADWNETHKILRTDFEFDIVTDKYTTNLAYASMERPVNAFNTYDEARFEVCAQDFIDMSEEGFGVSILSDVKNAYGVKGNRVSLALLKAPVSPDKTCDRGINEFTYSLYPHKGNWKEGGTVRKFGAAVGEALTVPLEKSGELLQGWIKCDCDNVIVEAVKKSEDKDGIIVRVLEKYGRQSKTTVTIGTEITDVKECNLMEEVEGDVSHTSNSFTFTIRPHEIKTFKIKQNR